MTNELVWRSGATVGESTMEDELGRRLRALARLCRLAQEYTTGDEVAAARELADRALARLSHSDGSHTVVALAGATGVGKSSLFNAIARHPLSPPGHLRPTTAAAHACVWDLRGADALLDWLAVAPQRRFRRESPLDAEDEAALRGLVLLDLPDIDSVAEANRREADRFVGIVDLVIWVLDPQKYADQTVHERYLAQLGALRDVTVVAFNQVDRLAPADADRCRADLTRLIEADGLAGVPVIATSTVTGEGVDELRTLLEKVVAGRASTRARLAAELGAAVAAVESLAPVAGPSELDLSHHAVPELADGLAAAGGVTALAQEAAAAYRDATRVLARPWRPAAALPAVPPADAGMVSQAVRGLAERAGRGPDGPLPEPWTRRLRVAAAAGADRLPDDLAQSLAIARGPVAGRRLGVLLRTVWWLSVVVSLAALVAGIVTGDAAGVLATGTVAFAVAVGLPVLDLASAGPRLRRHRREVEARLRGCALTVARETVAPVRPILRDYDEARLALLDAKG